MKQEMAQSPPWKFVRSPVPTQEQPSSSQQLYCNGSEVCTPYCGHRHCNCKYKTRRTAPQWYTK